MELYQHKPPDLDDAVSGPNVVSYKAPWDSQRATRALASMGMYEAAGNVMWLSPFPEDACAAINAGDKPTWDQVVDIQERHFSPSAVAPPHGSPSQHVFPVAMLAHVPHREIVRGQPHFPGSLTLVTGHVYLYAWFLGVLRAFQSGNVEAVASLWQAALMVTIQLRAGLSTAELAVLSIQHREQRKDQQ